MDKDGRLFSGYEYFLAHNDGNVTLDGTLPRWMALSAGRVSLIRQRKLKNGLTMLKTKFSIWG